MSIWVYNKRTDKAVKIVFDSPMVSEGENGELTFTKYLPYHKEFKSKPWLIFKYLDIELNFIEKIQFILALIFKRLIP
jgi:hypothetical protein